MNNQIKGGDKDLLKSLTELFFTNQINQLYNEPLEYIKLSDISGEENVQIPLSKHGKIVMKTEDIKRLKEDVPQYLHDKTSLPLHLKIISTGPIKLSIEGGIWQARILYYILNGKLLAKPKEIIESEEFLKILRKYPTLIHVSLVQR